MYLTSVMSVAISWILKIEDVVFGTPIANRATPKMEKIIGCLLNTIVIKNSMFLDKSFREIVQEVRSTTLDAFHHQDIPFDVLIKNLRPPRKLNVNPIFQILFALQNLPDKNIAFPSVIVTPENNIGLDSKLDLSINLSDRIDSYICYIEYKTTLFKHDTVNSLVITFLYLIENLSKKDEDISINSILQKLK